MPLTPEDHRDITALLAHQRDAHGACIDALRAVQRRHGWVSDENVKEIASLLGMTADEVDAVATFYNLVFRRPVGRHMLLVCDSVSCWIMGCDALREHLQTKLGIRPGETTPDGRFTLLPIVCLGHCERAPAMMVDDDVHGDLDDSGKVDRVLEGYS